MDLSARSLLRRVALVGMETDVQEPMELGENAWRPFVLDLTRERLLGLAFVASQRGNLALTEPQGEELMDRLIGSVKVALALERRLVELTETFRAEDLPFVVLKGPAVAHSFYPDPLWRGFGDLDVLVPTAGWDRALRLVGQLGFTRLTPEPRPGFDRRFGKAATHRGPGGLVLDLHRTLAKAPFGLWLDPEELFERADTFRCAGVELPRLDDTSALIHACLHAILGEQPLLMPLRDITQIATVGNVDWAAFEDLTRRWRLDAVVGSVAGAITDELGADVPPELAAMAGRPVSAGERRALEAFTTERRQHGAMSLSVIRTLPGARAKAAYVRALALPDKDFLRAMGMSSSLERLMSALGRATGRKRPNERMAP